MLTNKESSAGRSDPKTKISYTFYDFFPKINRSLCKIVKNKDLYHKIRINNDLFEASKIGTNLDICPKIRTIRTAYTPCTINKYLKSKESIYNIYENKLNLM